MFIKNLITNTYPLIIHAPDENKIWDSILENFNKSLCFSSFNCDDILVVTWNNFESSVLEQCLKKRKIPFCVLGKDIEVWNNLQKFFLTLKAIKNSKCKYFLGLDSHDVLVLGDLATILKRFKSKNCEILFNCEKKFYPNFSIEYFVENKKFQDKVSKGVYKYLNSGCWIGKREFCQKLFEECSNIRLWETFDCTDKLKLYNCDQSVIHGMFKKYYPKIQIDYNCDIFFNISFVKDQDLKILCSQ